MFQQDASEQIRRDQARAGRELARAEGGNRPVIGLTNKRRSSAPKKPRGPEGHEAHLKSLETSGAMLRVYMASGAIYTGIIKHSDKYTISLRTEPKTETSNGKKLVLFKHAIDAYEPLSAPPTKPETATVQ